MKYYESNMNTIFRDVPKSLEYKEGLEEQQDINRNLIKRNIVIEEELESEKKRCNDMVEKCENLEQFLNDSKLSLTNSRKNIY